MPGVGTRRTVKAKGGKIKGYLRRDSFLLVVNMLKDASGLITPKK